MSGHSQWKNIQHRKGAQDIKKGKAFTKVIKEITVAVKKGGPDANSNPALRLALANARGVNMPRDNVERAVKKASGENNTNLVDITFEGYGPGGVSIVVECATDNNTRTVANIRSYFNKFGGSLGKDGSLAFLFSRKSVFYIDRVKIVDLDDFTMSMIDTGVEDVQEEDDLVILSATMDAFGTIQNKLAQLNVEVKEAGLERIPNTTKEVDDATFDRLSKLISIIEDDEDVLKVYHNAD
jgi:YebC/PmpR family DNA-binding regulatory protein